MHIFKGSRKRKVLFSDFKRFTNWDYLPKTQMSKSVMSFKDAKDGDWSYIGPSELGSWNADTP